jgi:DNA-binding MarR family transcriptional regulator
MAVAQWEFSYTAIPNDFLDNVAPNLSPSELRVMLYIYRHTLGYRKLSDVITYDQFLNGIVTRAGRRLDNGAGVSRGALATALANLEKEGLVERLHADRLVTYRVVITTMVEDNTEDKEVQNLDSNVEKVGSEVEPTKETLKTFYQKKPNRAAVAFPKPDNTSEKELNITKKSENVLVGKVEGLNHKEALALTKIAYANGRDENYLLQLAEYVTTNPAIRVPAATFTALVKQNANRTVATKPKFAKSCSVPNVSNTGFGLAGLLGTEKAAYYRSLALSKGIGAVRLDEFLRSAKQAPHGSQRAVFERLFHAALSTSPYQFGNTPLITATH